MKIIDSLENPNFLCNGPFFILYLLFITGVSVKAESLARKGEFFFHKLLCSTFVIPIHFFFSRLLSFSCKHKNKPETSAIKMT